MFFIINDGDMPRLSIVMPFYNTENFIKETIESLLNQTFKDFELIVVDDGSTDKSPEIISSFKDPRIKLIQNEQRKGIVYSRNKGLSEANGEFYAPFDSDDIALPHKFERQIQFLQDHSDFGLIGSWTRMIDKDGKLLKKKWKLKASPQAIPSILLFRSYFGQPSVVMRRKAVPDEGYTEGFEIGEDYRMWVDVTRKWKVWNLQEYLTYYRIHEKSITQSNLELYSECELKLYKYIYAGLEIIINEHNCSLLRIIKNDSEISEVNLLKEIENFLLLIIEQNKRLKLYDQNQLERVIFNRWLKVCYKSRRHSYKVIQTFLSSPLRIKI